MEELLARVTGLRAFERAEPTRTNFSVKVHLTPRKKVQNSKHFLTRAAAAAERTGYQVRREGVQVVKIVPASPTGPALHMIYLTKGRQAFSVGVIVSGEKRGHVVVNAGRTEGGIAQLLQQGEYSITRAFLDRLCRPKR